MAAAPLIMERRLSLPFAGLSPASRFFIRVYLAEMGAVAAEYKLREQISMAEFASEPGAGTSMLRYRKRKRAKAVGPGFSFQQSG
jgi:hypothetical protein